jgi:hypothetical protein
MALILRGLSAAAQQHDRDGSRNASSGTCNRDEEKYSARGRTSLAPPSKRGAWTAGGTPNPGLDPTHRTSMRCPLAAGPRPRFSDIQAAEDWCSTVWLLVRDGASARASWEPITRLGGRHPRGPAPAAQLGRTSSTWLGTRERRTHTYAPAMGSGYLFACRIIRSTIRKAASHCGPEGDICVLMLQEYAPCRTDRETYPYRVRWL